MKFDFERSKRLLKKHCKERGIDLDKLAKDASPHFDKKLSEINLSNPTEQESEDLAAFLDWIES